MKTEVKPKKRDHLDVLAESIQRAKNSQPKQREMGHQMAAALEEFRLSK